MEAGSLPLQLQLHVDVALGLTGLVNVGEAARWLQFQRRQFAAPIVVPPHHSERARRLLQEAQRLDGLPAARRLFLQPVVGTRTHRVTRRGPSRVRMHPGLRELEHRSQYTGNATVDRDVCCRAATPAKTESLVNSEEKGAAKLVPARELISTLTNESDTRP